MNYKIIYEQASGMQYFNPSPFTIPSICLLFCPTYQAAVILGILV